METNKDKLLNQAVNILKKVLKYRSPGSLTCPQEEDLLTQEIEIYLMQFMPKIKQKNKYRQSDIDELIKNILRESKKD